MTKLFLTGIDLNKNPLNNAAIQNLSAPPSSPNVGQIYFDTALNALRVWDGTAWTNRATDSLLLQGQNGAYYLARANQTGTQLANTISNLNATVIAYTLDTFAPPVGSLNFNNQVVTNLGTPTNPGDAANKGYVDSVAQGLDPKPAARAATTAALPTSIYNNGAAGVGATLTATANGVLTVDSYNPAFGDLILVKNEGSQPRNGLYTLTTVGSGSSPWVLTRSVFMDTGTEFGGALVPVENLGAVNANTLWLCNVSESITVGTTNVTFAQLNSAVTISAGNGISISGNTVSVNAAAGGGIIAAAGGVSVDTSIVARKYSQTIGDGTSTSITVAHNLGTLDTVQSIYTIATGSDVITDITHSTVNTTTFGFVLAPAVGSLRVVICG